MVRHHVAAFGNADFRERAVRAFAREHESDHARHVGLERHHHQVAHQPGVLFEYRRDADGALHLRHVRRGLLLGLLDPPLDVANRFQILVELALVARAELRLPGAPRRAFT